MKQVFLNEQQTGAQQIESLSSCVLTREESGIPTPRNDPRDEWLLRDLGISPLSPELSALEEATGVLISGCHGGGKTTRAAKLAEFYSRRSRRVCVLPDVEFMRKGGFWTLFREDDQREKRDNFARHIPRLKKKDPQTVLIFVHSAQTASSRLPFVQWFADLERTRVVELRGETDPYLATLLGLDCCSAYTMVMAQPGIERTLKFLGGLKDAVGTEVFPFRISWDEALVVPRLINLRKTRKRQFDAFWKLVREQSLWNCLSLQ